MPVHFINEEKSPGMKRGGVLNIVRHEIEVICRPNASPSSSRSTSPAPTSASRSTSRRSSSRRVSPGIADRDFTVATIAGSSAMKPEEAAEPAAGRQLPRPRPAEEKE